jgi:hypothetical protein
MLLFFKTPSERQPLSPPLLVSIEKRLEHIKFDIFTCKLQEFGGNLMMDGGAIISKLIIPLINDDSKDNEGWILN